MTNRAANYSRPRQREQGCVAETPRWGKQFPSLWEQYLALVVEMRTLLQSNRGLAMEVCRRTNLSPSRVSQVILGRSPSLFIAMRIARALTALNAWDRDAHLVIAVTNGQTSNTK